MYIAGNILFTLAALSWLLALRVLYGSGATHGPDSGIGTGMAVLYLSLLFWVFLAGALFVADRSGGLSWMGITPGLEKWLAFAVLTGASWLVILCGFQYAGTPAEPPGWWLNILWKIAPVALPLMCLLLTGYSLLPALRTSIDQGAALALGWALAVPVIIANLAVAGIWVTGSLQQQQAILQADMARDENQRATWMEEIEAADPFNVSIARILTFTTGFREKDLREKAIAKLHENPDWPDMLASLAEGDAPLEALDYLAFNDVPDPAVMAPALEKAIFRVAAYIERNILQAGHPSELYPDRFLFDVEKCLLAADRLEVPEQDFSQAINALKTALSTDRDRRDFSFKAEARIDQWRQKHGQ